MSLDAIMTSEIEGEFLDRASVQSSIQRQLGRAADKRRVDSAEQGISELVVSLYRSAEEPLSEAHLHAWHRMVMSGRRDLRDLGQYRTTTQPMQVVSGRIDAPKVHFEAPPARRVPKQMGRFIDWFLIEQTKLLDSRRATQCAADEGTPAGAEGGAARISGRS
jgi:Fic family protein